MTKTEINAYGVSRILDEEHIDMVGDLEDVRSLLYFLHELFDEECLETDKLSGEDRWRVLDLIHNFKHFRILFFLLNEKFRSIYERNNNFEVCISTLCDLTKKTEVCNETLHTDEAPEGG